MDRFERSVRCIEKIYVATGINPVHEFVDKVLTLKETYANEVEKDECQLIKIYQILIKSNDTTKLFQITEYSSVEDL